ncbi:MAG: nucleoside-diphosphate sugar epimerase [Legionellales bacterium RIFCSPHIGHO2_12_FULL_37_14]|nr:MAG: nucleoside-diphosphate sugar epimerase [Legionellales bacterium RIFCSPHIGHO2_12_FULL_37_14]
MHVLITGGAGFIGSHLAEYHLKHHDKVYVVDNLETGLQSNLDFLSQNSNFEYEIANILTWPKLYEAVMWADRVYHMAAVVGVYKVLENPIAVLATNIAGCERVLRAVKDSKWATRLLIASSSEVYGTSARQPLIESDNLIFKSAAHSRWSYSISKLANESFGLAYAEEVTSKIFIARLFNIIGPRQTGEYGMVLPRFVNQAVNNKPITVYGSGKQTRSFCDVRDLVVMLDKLVSEDKAAGKIINVGKDAEISIEDLALSVKKLAKSSSIITHLSYKEAYGTLFEETKRRKPCLKKLSNLISYKYKWNLEDTILDLIKKTP